VVRLTVVGVSSVVDACVVIGVHTANSVCAAAGVWECTGDGFRAPPPSVERCVVRCDDELIDIVAPLLCCLW
jgi:hypothetical protein